tara:strand:- start:6015 stop:6386 length:372 start_codon:yes stop_codon:yes gene_type:complete
MLTVKVPVSIGELIDKITILEIKSEIFKGEKLKNVEKELISLRTVLNDLDIKIEDSLKNKMRLINSEIWEIERVIREYEKINRFDESFIDIARSVYKKNDIRASIKRDINVSFDSEFIEEKSY